MTREEKRELLEFLEEIGLTREHIQWMIDKTIERRVETSCLEDTSPKRSGSSFYDSPIWTTMRTR
jgi:hypothetical protein